MENVKERLSPIRRSNVVSDRERAHRKCQGMVSNTQSVDRGLFLVQSVVFLIDGNVREIQWRKMPICSGKIVTSKYKLNVFQALSKEWLNIISPINSASAIKPITLKVPGEFM